jgi:hypothetical protein
MSEWGPLHALAGLWEGNDGLDVSFHNEDEEVGKTGYLEKLQLKPFGPVDNGQQWLYGLDYRMAAWRHGEEDLDPFHTEVGYWLWDPRHHKVLRCFVIPRGAVLVAGAICADNARRFSLHSTTGSTDYGILEDRYFGANATTSSYECEVTINSDGTWSYDETSVMNLIALDDEELQHTDRNTLHKIGEAV